MGRGGTAGGGGAGGVIEGQPLFPNLAITPRRLAESTQNLPVNSMRMVGNRAIFQTGNLEVATRADATDLNRAIRGSLRASGIGFTDTRQTVNRTPGGGLITISGRLSYLPPRTTGGGPQRRGD